MTFTKVVATLNVTATIVENQQQTQEVQSLPAFTVTYDTKKRYRDTCAEKKRELPCCVQLNTVWA